MSVTVIILKKNYIGYFLTHNVYLTFTSSSKSISLILFLSYVDRWNALSKVGFSSKSFSSSPTLSIFVAGAAEATFVSSEFCRESHKSVPAQWVKYFCSYESKLNNYRYQTIFRLNAASLRRLEGVSTWLWQLAVWSIKSL